MEGAGTFCSLCRENGDLLVVFISVEWPEHTLTTWGGVDEGGRCTADHRLHAGKQPKSPCVSGKRGFYKSNRAVELVGLINSQHCVRSTSSTASESKSVLMTTHAITPFEGKRKVRQFKFDVGKEGRKEGRKK